MYVAYAVEGRWRVKEQMNKRKPDDEFANIHLSYFTADGKETVIYCPESRDAVATLIPLRKELGEAPRHETSPEAIEPLPKKPSEQADAISDIQPEIGCRT